MSRLAIEIGGTFTDVMWLQDGGRLRTHKTPSTPDDPAAAVFTALEEIGLDPAAERLGAFVHGSTVATNAVLTRRGARAGLLVTRGFRDVLALQRQLRANVYDPFPRKPEPVIPGRLTREVAERLDHRGEVLEPLDEDRLLAGVRELVEDHGVESLALCLLHAYRNPVHERRALEVIAGAYPDLPVMASSDVLPVFREYERASATAICAYIVPRVRDYLERLDRRFRAGATPMFIMQSSGGVLPPEGIARRPIELLESGPAAGVTAALAVAERLGDAHAITLDMGGTSTDVCLITGGRAEQSSEREIDGLPLGIPSLDIVNVGAGGGSLGFVDAGGMLQVGPDSAGADPGPACYGRGGERPALTDALVALGWLRPEAFLGGAMPLDAAAAARALGEAPETTAAAMVRIAVAHIARAVSQVSVQRGRDPRGYAIYAYGGMGPMVAALAAEDLRVGRVVVPVHPGLFSALGLLLADLKRTYEQTRIMALRDGGERAVADAFAGLEAQAAAELAGYGVAPEAIRYDHTLTMRYQGQGFELAVPVERERISLPYLVDEFHAAHRAAYGDAVPANVVEVVTLRVEAVAARGGGVLDDAPAGAAGEDATRPIVWDGERRDCRFVARSGLGAGAVLDGPAIVEEPTATTLVAPGWRATVADDGSLMLERT
jgi:N-methylhydantoinase A